MPPTPTHTDDEDFDRILRGFVQTGANLVAEIERRAQETPVAESAEAFERITRAVRRTILLVQKRAEPHKARAAARRRIVRDVEDSIDNHGNNVDATALRRELAERLDAPDLEDDIESRPIAEIIVEIRRDLGLDDMPFSTPWRRRTPADVELIAACAAALPRLPRTLPRPTQIPDS